MHKLAFSIISPSECTIPFPLCWKEVHTAVPSGGFYIMYLHQHWSFMLNICLSCTFASTVPFIRLGVHIPGTTWANCIWTASRPGHFWLTSGKWESANFHPCALCYLVPHRSLQIGRFHTKCFTYCNIDLDIWRTCDIDLIFNVLWLDQKKNCIHQGFVQIIASLLN